MRIYFSGIGGVGIGPLAEIALDAGYDVYGSDREASPMTKSLQKRGVQISFDQSGDFLRSEHEKSPFDWFVYTAALPGDHPKLIFHKSPEIRFAFTLDGTNVLYWNTVFNSNLAFTVNFPGLENLEFRDDDFPPLNIRN